MWLVASGRILLQWSCSTIYPVTPVKIETMTKDLILAREHWKVFSIIKIVVDRFKESVAWWTSKKYSFLFNDKIEKGEIIEVLLKEITRLERKIRPQTNFDKIKDIATLVRQEVHKIPNTFDGWPPPSDKLTMTENCELPPNSKYLLSCFLSTRGEKRISSGKLLVIESIGQDMIYNITNGAHRTSNHIKLALCTKCKTGSKDMVKWINRLGHGISYDKVNFLETFLAEEATKHQEVFAHCPCFPPHL